MTSVSPTSSEELSLAVPQAVPMSLLGRLAALAGRGAGWLERAIDHLNPILVKETRQALKSRQFVLTFLIVLIACWIASFAVVAIIGPEIYYGAEGALMLWVYCVILAFPLTMIVPYSAFRSLAVEQEDNTYELLSITTLSTRRIVTGKLGSAAVQMLVYLSAVSPCIGFTFLLRGVDALTVVVLIGFYILASMGLSMVALLAGTAARVRYTQVLLSVLLVLASAGVFIATIPLAGEFIQDSYAVLRDAWFWVGLLAFLTLYVTTFALFHSAAAAQIAFASENRSTPLRRLMVLQFGCFLGWMTVPLIEEGMRFVGLVVFIAAMISGIYWYVMGALLTSEWPHVSRRVQRSLPKSRIGRMFLTWFNPGPGTGYLFVVANLTVVLVVGMVLNIGFGSALRWWTTEGIGYFLLLGWSYLVLFLGTGRLLISLMRRFFYVSLTAGFLLHIILLLLACGIPPILAFMSRTLRFNNDYSLFHLSNPIWTLETLVDSGVNAFDVFTATTLVGSAALVVFLLNVRAAAADLHLQRRELPARIAEEEAALHPAPEPQPTNPWEQSSSD